MFKLGPKSFGDGRRTFAKIKHLISSCWLLRLKLSRVKLYFVFACKTENRRFCNLEFLFLFTFDRNIQCAKKVLRLAMEYQTVINKIVFTSPEAMVEFSGGKKLKLGLSACQKYSFERSRYF